MRTIKQITDELRRAIKGHQKAYEDTAEDFDSTQEPKYTYREMLAEKIDLLNCLLHDIESPQDDFPQSMEEWEAQNKEIR